MKKNKIILIADDDPDDIMLFEEAVKEIDETIICNSYPSCELLLKNFKDNAIDPYPDLIFLDINMPRLNGIDCLKELKILEATKGIPIIMYSTSSNPRDIETCKKLGAVYFLKKPSNLDQLHRELGDLLNREF